jgi:hypothetical protein
VVLSGKSGHVFADAATRQRPSLKALFTTGLDAGVQLFSKPFTFEQLAKKVHEVLD